MVAPLSKAERDGARRSNPMVPASRSGFQISICRPATRSLKNLNQHRVFCHFLVEFTEHRLADGQWFTIL